MTNNVGGYRKTLTPLDIRYIELRCRGLMAQFGYVSDGVALDGRAATEEIDRLKPLLTQGRYLIEDEREIAIRRRRLDALERVLERRLP